MTTHVPLSQMHGKSGSTHASVGAGKHLSAHGQPSSSGCGMHTPSASHLPSGPSHTFSSPMQGVFSGLFSKQTHTPIPGGTAFLYPSLKR